MNNKIESNLVGKTFEELSFEEMAMSQGSGEIQPKTSAACVASVLASSAWCSASAISSMLLSLKIC